MFKLFNLPKSHSKSVS